MTVRVLDIETDGLLDDVTKMHCAVLYDIIGDGYEAFTDIAELCKRLDTVDRLIGHNLCQYDLMVLEKLVGYRYKGDVGDTLILSRLENPDRPGGHSLEAWASSFGYAKVENEDWSVYTEHMLHRCIVDTQVTQKLWQYFEENFLSNHSNEKAADLEFDVARIIGYQELNGVAFDRPKAVTLVAYLNGLIEQTDLEILDMAPPQVKKVGTTVLKPYKMNGELSARAIKYASEGAVVRGSFDAISILPLSQSSHKQMKDWFLSIGWKPDVWNYKEDPATGDKVRSSPKLEGDSLTLLPRGIGGKYTERLTQAHRRSQIEGWIGRIRYDGRITAGCNTIGTNTNRFRHRGVVNVPKATDKVFLGKEMRSLFTVPKRKRLVGHDASQLELRLFAAFVDDPEYVAQVLDGDIHTYNQNLAGLATRDEAKTFIYALLYGAGDAKIGSIVGGGKREGAKVRKKFLDGLPGYDALVKKIKKQAKRGYLDGLDGRKIWMRRDDSGRIMDHKSLNTYIQSAGAIVMKKSMVLLSNQVELNKLDVIKVLDMHDEAQAEVSIKDADAYGELAVQSIRDAGSYYNLECPLDAEYKVGLNWSDTH